MAHAPTAASGEWQCHIRVTALSLLLPLLLLLLLLLPFLLRCHPPTHSASVSCGGPLRHRASTFAVDAGSDPYCLCFALPSSHAATPYMPCCRLRSFSPGAREL